MIQAGNPPGLSADPALIEALYQKWYIQSGRAYRAAVTAAGAGNPHLFQKGRSRFS